MFGRKARLIATLKAANLQVRVERDQLALQLHSEKAQKGLVEQARDHYKTEAERWEARASKFIDQVAIAAGILSSPAMAAAEASGSHKEFKSALAALGRTSINRPTILDPPAAPAAGVLGVNERAAADAVNHVLERT